MGCKQTSEGRVGLRLAKEEVAQFGRLRGLHARANIEPPDLLQCVGDARRVTGELHRGGIGQILTLPRDGRTDQVTEGDACCANHQHRDADHQHRRCIVALPTSEHHARVHAAGEQPPPDAGNSLNARYGCDEPDGDAHVAVEDVAELMRHHTLQLRTIQRTEAASRDRDRRIVHRVARCEGVDALLLVEDIDQRERHPRGDGHLLDHIEQLPLVGVTRVARHELTAHRLRHRFAARGERSMLEQCAEPDGSKRGAGRNESGLTVPPDPAAGMRRIGRKREDPYEGVEADRNGSHRHNEEPDEGSRLPFRLRLMFRKVPHPRRRSLSSVEADPRCIPHLGLRLLEERRGLKLEHGGNHA